MRIWNTLLIVSAVLLILVGFFSPWIPHRAAGLALTGFEIGEWIKFAPEVRSGESPLRRANFYWPPVIAAIGLLALANDAQGNWRWHNWLLALAAMALALFPLPLLEEIGNLAGIKANLGRLLMIALPMVSAILLIIRRPASRKLQGGLLLLVNVAGLVLVSQAFGHAEPIIERLYGHLIDPGLGFHMARLGMLLLALDGLLDLLSRRPSRPSSEVN